MPKLEVLVFTSYPQGKQKSQVVGTFGSLGAHILSKKQCWNRVTEVTEEQTNQLPILDWCCTLCVTHVDTCRAALPPAALPDGQGA